METVGIWKMLDESRCKNWGGYAAGLSDPWAVATGVSVCSLAAQWNCSVLLQTHTRVHTPATPQM
jgi:hypothetical protein